MTFKPISKDLNKIKSPKDEKKEREKNESIMKKKDKICKFELGS